MMRQSLFKQIDPDVNALAARSGNIDLDLAKRETPHVSPVDQLIEQDLAPIEAGSHKY